MAQLPIRDPIRGQTRSIASPQALLGLANLIRRRLRSTVQDTIRTGVQGVVHRVRPTQPAATQPDAVVVAAAAEFAPNAYARARLLRQLHACGLLTEQETTQAGRMLDVAN